MCWQRHRNRLEAYAWEELCRASVPYLHRVVPAIAGLGPFTPAQRYWRGNDPELDIVARSVAGSDVLVGEASGAPAGADRAKPPSGSEHSLWDASVRALMFTPEAPGDGDANVVDASAVLDALHQSS